MKDQEKLNEDVFKFLSLLLLNAGIYNSALDHVLDEIRRNLYDSEFKGR